MIIRSIPETLPKYHHQTISMTYIDTDFIENHGKTRYKSTSFLKFKEETLSMYRVLTEILIILIKISKTFLNQKTTLLLKKASQECPHLRPTTCVPPLASQSDRGAI